jgi:hypothetical protein
MHKQLKVMSVVRAGEENGRSVLRIVGKTDSELDSSLVTEITMYAFTDKPNLVFGEYLVDKEAALVIDEEGATIFFDEAECEVRIDGIVSYPVNQCISNQPIPPEEYYKDSEEPFPIYPQPYWHYLPMPYWERFPDITVSWDSRIDNFSTNPTVTESND